MWSNYIKGTSLPNTNNKYKIKHKLGCHPVLLTVHSLAPATLHH